MSRSDQGTSDGDPQSGAVGGFAAPYGAPMPPFQPPSQQASPTPPYGFPPAGAVSRQAVPEAGSPLQRLRDTRRDAGAPRTSAHPDGAPAPLPRFLAGGRAGGTTGGAAAGKVVQRFTGTGITPQARVRRQERRARRATVMLAVVAVVLITSSAFLLFDPAIQLPSFGFAIGTRYHAVDSGKSITLYQDPPTATPSDASPTPTAASPTPNPTSPTATPPDSPTSTAAPTATPMPTATATPTYGPGTLTFYRTAKPLTVSQTMTATACNGCSLDPATGTLPATTRNYSNQISYGAYGAWVQSTSASQQKMNIHIRCYKDPQFRFNVCPSVQMVWLDSSANQNRCDMGNVGTMQVGQSMWTTCTYEQYGHFNYNDLLSSDTNSYWQSCQTPDPSGGGLVYGCFVSVDQYSVNTYGSWASTTYYMPDTSTCMSQGNNGANVQNNARSVASQAVSGGQPDQISGNANFPAQYFCSDVNTCNAVGANQPMPGNHNQYSQCQPVTAWRFSYTATDAHTLQMDRLKSAVEQYYTLDPAASACASGSPVQGTENSNHTSVQISCAASGRELYNWDYNNGQFKQQLQAAIAGKTITEALSILKQTAGVDTTHPMTVCAQVNGSNVCSSSGGTARLPSDPAQIALNINTP